MSAPGARIRRLHGQGSAKEALRGSGLPVVEYASWLFPAGSITFIDRSCDVRKSGIRFSDVRKAANLGSSVESQR